MQLRSLTFCGGAAAVVVASLVAVPPGRSADDPAAAKAAPVPVETDMHEFMEYAFQEPYKRMKVAMAAAPANNAGWKGIKSDALLLAEAGNLLLMRGPDEKRTEWEQHSVAVRTAAGELYQAGKARKFDEAQPKWATLIQKCNACHTAFADGEHQLEP